MEPLKRIKVKVTSKKFDKGKSYNKVISIPEFLQSDFLQYDYGEIVKESPENLVTPEEKVKKKPGRKPKTKE